MLPYKNRLIKNENFALVHRYGRFFSFGNLILKVKKNDLGITRIGFSIGLNFSKKAVERNKIKRQLRAIAFQELNQIKPGFDIIVMVKKIENKAVASAELEKNWKSALEKGKLIIK